MCRPSSPDLREWVVGAVRSWMNCQEAAERFEICTSSSTRWVEHDRESDSPAALPMGGKWLFSLELATPGVQDHGDPVGGDPGPHAYGDMIN